MALPAPRVHAQTPTVTGGQGKIDGQIVDGTKDAKLVTTPNITVTLHMAPAGAQTTISQTVQADTGGRFSFSNLDTITTTRYLVIATYQNVDYYSEILSFAQGQTTLPVTTTVYETTTDPSVIAIPQSHFVFDVQTGLFNVFQIIAVQNNSDRTYIGSTPIGGPHRATLTLPFMAGAQNIEFDNPAANDSTLRGSDAMTYTLPFTPGSDQIVYNYTLPFTPPTYNFSVKMPFDSTKVQILLSDVGGTVSSPALSTPAPFPTQMGQNYLLSSADNVKAGTVITATFANLPATVGQQTPAMGTAPSASAPVATPANNNVQLVGGVVLGIAAVAALALLLYPIVLKRNAHPVRRAAAPEDGRRMELLQDMADLDDDFEANKISETDYKEQRARLKAELLTLSKDGE